MTLVQRWQDVAFQTGEYATKPVYSVVLELLVSSESSESKQLAIKLNGNQPALKKHRLTDEDTAVLLQALGDTAVKRIDLSYNMITDSGSAHVADYLKRVGSSVERLDLAYNDITSEGAQVLADALQLNTSLTDLSLAGNHLERKGGIAIAAMLQVNRSLRSLNLSSTDTHTDCVIAMATVLQGNTTLQCVDLSRPLLHSKLEESTIHLSRMLQVNCTLRELHLSKHAMTDTGLEWLCRALKRNTHSQLSTLDISCNKFSRDGALYLSQLLLTDPCLSTLNLDCNRIQDEGLQHISHALSEGNTQLKQLSVCSNGISTEGLLSLTGALLSSNKTLSSVFIWGNVLQEPTATAIKQLLEQGRLDPDKIDVEPYEVDGIMYLSQTSK